MTHTSTLDHENAHAQILKYNGCNNVTVKINLLGASYAQCNHWRTMSQEERLLEYQLHSLNEIVTYNLRYIAGLIFGSTLFLGYAIHTKS